MMTTQFAYTQRDLARAVSATKSAGQQVSAAFIDNKGAIVVIIKQPEVPRGPCVYFVASKSGPVKIGFTNGRLRSRIKALQTGNPSPLTLIIAAAAERKLEAAVHRYLAADRIIGEWFKRSRRLERLIEGVGRGEPLSDLLHGPRLPSLARDGRG